MERKNRGVTLASMAIMIIIMIIIATVSVVVGTKIILEAKEEKREENLLAVKNAVIREAAKASMSGVITPGGYEFIGTQNPLLQSASGTRNAGENWYLLDSNDLEELGIEGVSENYVVNYKLQVAILLTNEEDIFELIELYENDD